jgi:gamma-glutamyltranspeptidase/glutathione hydrolase
VIDKWGNIVSATQTLGEGFGRKVMIKGTGIWMNNAMAFATYEPKGNPMDVFPGKYKLSDNAPIIIMRNKLPWAALGTPGGHTIIQNVAQIVINLIDFHMNMQQAIDAPKLVFVEENKSIFAEEGIPKSVTTELSKMGHKINNKFEYIGISKKIGNAMGIRIIPNKNFIAFDVGLDKRRDAWVTPRYSPSS